MKSSSLQRIEDKYVRQGYRGKKLRQVLLQDREYIRLVQQRKTRLSTQIKVDEKEKSKYVLSIDDDFEILKRCKQLESMPLSHEDGQLLKLIKSQLEYDWRRPLLNKLNNLFKKYSRVTNVVK